MTPETEHSSNMVPTELLPLPLPTSPCSSIKNPAVNKEITMSNGNSGSSHRVYHYPEFYSTCPIVIKGGFSINKEKAELESMPMRQFPPPPMAAYDKSSGYKHYERIGGTLAWVKKSAATSVGNSCSYNGGEIEPKNYRDSTAGRDLGPEVSMNSAVSKEQIDQQNTTKVSSRIKGERFTDTTHFERVLVKDAREFRDTNFSTDEQRIGDISGIGHGGELEYCRKCMKNHIPPGSPLTLQVRDTCGAYLPEWFPIEKIPKPWDTFIALLNEMVALDEMSQGYTHGPNPDGKLWDLEFHELHYKWKQVGRKSGWWKCRAGPDAPPVEKNCDVCHRVKTPQEVAVTAKKRGSVYERKEAIMAFIRKRMQAIADKDKAIVLERIRTEGWPQHLGMTGIKFPPHILAPINRQEALPNDYFKTSFSSDHLADCELTRPAQLRFPRVPSHSKPLAL